MSEHVSDNVRSILVIRAGVLGDVVLATSVLEPLRMLYPRASIEWVVAAPYAPLLEGVEGISRVHRLGRGRAFAALCRELAGRFDLAIDLQNKVRTRWLAFWAAERRIAFLRRQPLQALGALLGRDVVFDGTPQVRLFANTLEKLVAPFASPLAPGRLQVSFSEAARERARAALGVSAGRAIILAPSTRWDSKRWPVERFAAVADALAAQGHPIALLGGPADAPLLEKFRALTKAEIAADLSSLEVEEVAAAISQSRLLVGCDSGPMHLATATGTPGVAVFGPTSASRWGPPPPSQVVTLGLSCSPCSNHGTHTCPLGHHRCMNALSVEQVLEAVRQVQHNQKRTTPPA